VNYEEAVAYIHGKYGKGVKAGLENMTRLLHRLGDPHKGLNCVHVAGTNGKGSTCAFLDSVLRRAGFKVGLYTSPYLMRYNERMRVDGREIPDETVARLTTVIARQVREMEERGEGFPTVFEIGTALMFLWFAEEKVDFAVVEVGLGGRLDPTNVLTPRVSVITRIGLDHTRVLGDTVEKIAAEKGGIIKEGAPVVLQKQDARVRPVIEKICREKHAPLWDCAQMAVEDVRVDESGASFAADLPGWGRKEYRINLCGAHQVDNAVTALGAVSALLGGGPDASLAAAGGLVAARWPGRLEWLGNVLLDGAHNPQGARTVEKYVRDHLAGRRVILLTGVMADKDVEGLADILAPLAGEAICVKPEQMARAEDAEALAALYRARTDAPVRAMDSAKDALAAAKKSAGEGDVILVCGSLYLVGEIRKILAESGEGRGGA
jgi:dihydrofolate synthase/folylpolyglutamate synthase